MFYIVCTSEHLVGIWGDINVIYYIIIYHILIVFGIVPFSIVLDNNYLDYIPCLEVYREYCITFENYISIAKNHTI